MDVDYLFRNNLTPFKAFYFDKLLPKSIFTFKMKKIISGMLICASLAGTMGAFTSCKDTIDDEYTVLAREDFRIIDKLQALQAALDAAKKGYEQQLADAKKELTDAMKNGYVSKADFEALQKRVTTLEGQICKCGDIAAKLATLESTIKDWVGQQGYMTSAQVDEKLKDYLKSADLENLFKQYLDQNEYITKAALEEALKGLNTGGGKDFTNEIKQIQDALAALGVNTDGTIKPGTSLANAVEQAQWVTANKTAIENALKTLEGLDLSKFLTADQASNLYLTKEDFENYKKGLKDDLAEFVNIYNEVAQENGLTGNFTDLKSLLTEWAKWRNGIEEKVNNNALAIKALQAKYNVLNDRLDAMITSIHNEGTWNPIFGSFSAPIGVTSNVLLAYYGEMAQTVKFPYAGSLYEFDGEQVITSADMKMMNPEKKVYSGVVLQGDESNYIGNAGCIYMTVNPGNVSMLGKKFALVNSLNKEHGIKLATPVVCEKELTFGYNYGRANNDVCIYEVPACITPDDVPGAQLQLEPGLKSAATDFYHNRSKRDLAELMVAVAKQLNGMLPRLAVKAEWSYTKAAWDDTSASWVNTTEESVVRSGLDIAGTAFKPLSFKTLEGKGFGRQLPILAELNIDWNKVIPKLKEIKLPTISLDDLGFNIQISLGELDLSKIKNNLEVTVTANGVITLDNGDVKTVTVTGTGKIDDENWEKFIAEMQKTLSEQLQEQLNRGVTDKINKEFNNLLTNLQKKINTTLTSTQTQINDMVDDLVNKIKNNLDEYTGRPIELINVMINKYNSVANRVNGYLKNPNHFMQATMLFKNGSSLGFLSTNASAPTQFVLNGGNSLLFIPTTYNVELVSPAFKKFVGVCDAVNLSTGKSAQEGDAAAVAAVNSANNSEYINKVVDGKFKRINTGALKPGFKYTVVYSALDYRGFTSTNKYYIQVNN